MNELNILVEQIQRKQESSMGMVQALKTIAEQKERNLTSRMDRSRKKGQKIK